MRTQVEVHARYAGYIERAHAEIARAQRNEETALPPDLDYARLTGLSHEVRQRLTEVRPATLGQAARVPGVTPAAVSILLVHLKKRALACAAEGRMSPFTQQLEHAWETNDSLVCVGLDPEIERFPDKIRAQPSPIFQFNRAIIDATADLVCAYKPQFAHYAAYEAEDQLERTIEYVHRASPGRSR